MTGKELLIVLGGATVLGGGAGAAVMLLSPAPIAPAPAPATVTDARLQARFDELDREFRASRAALDEARASLVAMQERVVELENRPVARTRVVGEGVGPGEHEFDATWEEEGVHAGFDKEKLQTELEKAAVDLSHIALDGGALRVGRLINAQGVAELGAEMGAGLRLRMLPEEERWQKAQEELGLDASQIQSLKDAATERDRAIEEALVTENVAMGRDGGEITVRRLDPERAADANRAYRERVNGNLTADQQKTWKEKGYDHAFGRTPMGSIGGGGSAVMTMTIQSDHGTRGVLQEKAGSGTDKADSE